MKSITELLTDIKSAIFGKDVRNSIHDAIKTCYEDATKIGNSNMEVSLARGKFETLNQRLDNIDENKIEKNTFDKETLIIKNQLKSLASGSPKIAAGIEEMVDTSKIYVNIDNGHWYFFDNLNWQDGGIYQSIGIDKEAISFYELNNEITNNISYLKSLYILWKDSSHYRVENNKAVESNLSDSYKSFCLNVNPGEVYKLRCITNSSNTQNYLICDSDDNVLEIGETGKGVKQANEYVVKIPVNGAKLYLSTFWDVSTSESQPYLYLYKNKDTNYISKEIELTSKLKENLNKKKLNIIWKESSYYKIEDNKIVEYNNSSNYVSTFFDVKENEFYEINLVQASPIVIRYCFTDDENNVVSYGGNYGDYSIGNPVREYFENYIVKVPSRATKLFISGYNYSLLNYVYKLEASDKSNLYGKTISLIGDSISTKENKNAVEIKIEKDDVGIELSAYLTYYDVKANLSLGGHIFTEDEIGTEVTFKPIDSDVGKVIGRPANYNDESITTWWETLEEKLGVKVNPVCWSGSSVTSHESNKDIYKTSYAWHEAQIRKCGIRKVGSMSRLAPDIIIIYRGTNDFSHSPYAQLTDIDEVNFNYSNNDKFNENYSYTLGLITTIQKIRETYPKTRIFICTLNVFKRVQYTSFPTRNGINSLPQYNNNIRKIANFMGCDVIEFDKNGITFENCYNEGYMTDSEIMPTHPNTKGHSMLANKAINELRIKY